MYTHPELSRHTRSTVALCTVFCCCTISQSINQPINQSIHQSMMDYPYVMLQASFKKEVTETFLRCVKMGYEQDLAVIELNGLKIAEDRTFADCARHVFASILDLCLPSTTTCKAEYQSLFPPDAPDTDTQVGLVQPPPPTPPHPFAILPVSGDVGHTLSILQSDCTFVGKYVESARLSRLSEILYMVDDEHENRVVIKNNDAWPA